MPEINHPWKTSSYQLHPVLWALQHVQELVHPPGWLNQMQNDSYKRHAMYSGNYIFMVDCKTKPMNKNTKSFFFPVQEYKVTHHLFDEKYFYFEGRWFVSCCLVETLKKISCWLHWRYLCFFYDKESRRPCKRSISFTRLNAEPM